MFSIWQKYLMRSRFPALTVTATNQTKTYIREYSPHTELSTWALIARFAFGWCAAAGRTYAIIVLMCVMWARGCVMSQLTHIYAQASIYSAVNNVLSCVSVCVWNQLRSVCGGRSQQRRRSEFARCRRSCASWSQWWYDRAHCRASHRCTSFRICADWSHLPADTNVQLRRADYRKSVHTTFGSALLPTTLTWRARPCRRCRHGRRRRHRPLLIALLLAGSATAAWAG